VTSKNAAIVGIACLALAGGIWLVFSPGPSDQEQIKEALAKSIKASREGRPGGVLELLSSNFKVNNTEYSTSSTNFTNAIRNYKPDLKVANTTPAISGDQATIISDVTLDASILSMHKTVDIPQATFTFHKESGTKWGLIPSKDWKLDQVTIPQSSVDQVMAQFQ